MMALRFCCKKGPDMLNSLPLRGRVGERGSKKATA
jgi:hypothetical protein